MTSSQRQPFALLGWLVSIVACCYIVTAFTLSAVPYVSRINPAIALVLGPLVAIRLVAVGGRGIPKSFVFPVLFVAFAALSVLWSPDRDVAKFMVAYTAFSTVGGLSIVLILGRELSWRMMCWAGIAACLIVIISAQAQIREVGADARIAGMLLNANSLAVILSYAAFMIWCCPTKVPRWMMALAAAFVGYAFLFSGSRKMLIVLGGVLVLAAVKIPERVKQTGARLAIGLGFVVLAILLGFLYQGRFDIVKVFSSIKAVERTRGKTAEAEQSSEIRREMFFKGLQLWTKSPLIGYGEGQFSVVSGFGGYAHNNYTEILANLGMIGFVLHYALLTLVLHFASVQYYFRDCWIMLAFLATLALAPIPKRAMVPSSLPRFRPVRTARRPA